MHFDDKMFSFILEIISWHTAEVRKKSVHTLLQIHKTSHLFTLRNELPCKSAYGDR